MASLMQNASQPASAPLPPDLEPDNQWKQELKLKIEAGLRSMVDEAKQKQDDELAKGIIGPEERDRLTSEHLATLRTIRQLAEEQFRIALERERQERRWASGEQFEPAWPESMMKEQQAIMDRIEREPKAFIMSPQSDPPHLPPLPQALAPPPPPPPPPPAPVQFHSKPDVPSESATPTPVPSNRKPNRLTRSPTYNVDLDGRPYFPHSTNRERNGLPTSPDEISSAFRPTRKVHAGPGPLTSISFWKAPSILESEKSILERSRPMPIYDKPESMSRSARTPTDLLDPTRKESIRRKPSMTARSITQEFWKPSITPEEDASKPSRTAHPIVPGFWKPSITPEEDASKPSRTAHPIVQEFWKPSITPEEDASKPRRTARPIVQEFWKPSITPEEDASKPNRTARPIVPEFWKPSITPEEDAKMSRTFTFVRRNNNASDTATFSDPLNVANNIDCKRAGIRSADQERASMDRARARDRDRDRDRPGYYNDDRPLQDRMGFAQSPATSPPNSATYVRVGSDVSRVLLPSASRPIVNKRSFTIDDTFLPPSSSPSTRRDWPSSTSSVLRSPDEVVPRSWQSSQLRRRFSTQDMRHHFQSEGGYYRARTHHHEDFGGGGEDGSDDGFDTRSWRTRPVDYDERRIQDIEEGLRKREEAANRREEELARKAGELKREDDERQKMVERMEEEAKGREEDEAERKEAELRKKEEEAERTEREAAMKEEEARMKEMQTKRKEEELRKKEKEANSREMHMERTFTFAREPATPQKAAVALDHPKSVPSQSVPVPPPPPPPPLVPAPPPPTPTKSSTDRDTAPGADPKERTSKTSEDPGQLLTLPPSAPDERRGETLNGSGSEGKHTERSDAQAPGLESTENLKSTPTYLDRAGGSLIGIIRSRFPHDLTGHIKRSEQFAFASGGCGDIYRGVFDMKERSLQVAIKACKMYLQCDHVETLNKNLRRFRREITVWLKLDHPNVLPLLGTIRDHRLNPQIPAMVSPWAENGALSAYLERNDKLPVSRRAYLVNDVAQGLHYLHSQNIVHGDLSGSNVLIHGDGNACISDFGLATLLTHIGGSTFATTRAGKGTLRWMAPELFCTDGIDVEPTMQSDVYSFGSVMLQILTSRIPYHYLPRDAQVTMAILKGQKPSRPDPDAVVTEDRWRFIEWCWYSANAEPRPSSDQIVEFTREELVKLGMR